MGLVPTCQFRAELEYMYLLTRHRSIMQLAYLGYEHVLTDLTGTLMPFV